MIAKGDTIGGISRKYNISVKDILSKNPGIENADVIHIGQKIVF